MYLFNKSYFILALSVVLLSGCGQTGPLFLEDGDSEAAKKYRQRQAYAIEAAAAEAAIEARKQAKTNETSDSSEEK